MIRVEAFWLSVKPLDMSAGTETILALSLSSPRQEKGHAKRQRHLTLFPFRLLVGLM